MYPAKMGVRAVGFLCLQVRREEKYEEELRKIEPKVRSLSKADADKFFDRLMADTDRRKRNQ